MNLLNYLASALVMGFIVAIPPGAVTIVACQHALRHGFRTSLPFSLGSSAADITYIVLVHEGLTRLITGNETGKIVMWLVCGVLLTIFGIRSFFDSTATGNDKTAVDGRTGYTALFVQGYIITLSNPVTIAGWLAVAGNFFLLWQQKWPASPGYLFPVTLAIMTGVLLWFLPLTYGVSRLHRLISSRIQKFLVRITGTLLLLFGITALTAALRSLLR